LATAFDTSIVVINLNGVWGFRGTSAKGGKIALPDIHSIAWNQRQVVIAFDSDVIRKREVMAALQQFANIVEAKGVAGIRVLMLPDDPKQKLGVDDYLAQKHSIAELEAHLVPHWMSQVSIKVPFGIHPETRAELFTPPGYTVVNHRIVRINNNGSGPWTDNLYWPLIFH